MNPENPQNNQENTQQETGKGPDLAAGARLLGLAALGALVAIGEGGGRLFQTLVEKGEKYEPEGRERLKAVGEKVGRAAGKVENAVRDFGGRVRGLMEKGEEALDDRVASALHRAGLPTREEIQSLIDRVDVLAAKLEEIRARVRPETQPGA